MNKHELLEKFEDITYDVKHFFKDIWNWIRYHTYNRYHMLDLRTKKYRYGWMDQDWRMFHACFNCLVEFVEKEDGLGMLEYQIEAWQNDKNCTPEEQEKLAKEAKELFEEVKCLYEWWKEGREKEENEIDHLCDGIDMSIKFLENPDLPEGCVEWDNSHYRDNPVFLEYCRRHDEFKNNDDVMLDRLMKVRKYLWT